MSGYDNDNTSGFVDKRKVGRTTSVTNASTSAEIANYGSISTLRTRLAAIDGTYYNTARLEQMNDNDMVYALRVKTGDLAGI